MALEAQTMHWALTVRSWPAQWEVAKFVSAGVKHLISLVWLE